MYFTGRYQLLLYWTTEFDMMWWFYTVNVKISLCSNEMIRLDQISIGKLWPLCDHPATNDFNRSLRFWQGPRVVPTISQRGRRLVVHGRRNTSRCPKFDVQNITNPTINCRTSALYTWDENKCLERASVPCKLAQPTQVYRRPEKTPYVTRGKKIYKNKNGLDEKKIQLV